MKEEADPASSFTLQRFPSMRLPPFTAGLLLFGLLAASCGSSRPAVYPVRGQVAFKGRPTPGAIVVFHPANNDDPKALRPNGQVKEDGSFTLSTFKPDDGAPEGEYDVAIVWTAGAKPNAQGDIPNKLPEHYADPHTSGLRVKVEKGTNNLDVFQLTR